MRPEDKRQKTEDRSRKSEIRRHKKGAVYMVFHLFSVICLMSLISACATSGTAKKTSPGPGTMSSEQRQLPQPRDLKLKTEDSGVKTSPPEFMPVSEELSPLKTRFVSIRAVKGTTLRDVVYVIAEATGLNLVMEKGVDPETPVTLTLNNVSAEDAIETVFASVDYFYSIKDNMLIVKALETRIFELGRPSVLEDYAVDVGGDILGGSSTAITSGTSSVSSVKGSITQKKQSDKDSFKLWESIEKNIGTLIGHTETAQAQQGTMEKSQPEAAVSINRMTGTIIVTATKKDLGKVEEYLTGIRKIINRQVIVEASIVEVQLSEELKYGIDWSVLALNNITNITFGMDKFSSVVGDTLPNFQIGISKGGDITSQLKALQTQGEVRVLSNPRANIMNGQTALLSVGRNVSFVSRVETSTSTAATGTVPTTTFSIQTSSVLSGIIIGIVPFINEKGEVSMSITPIVSDLVKLENRSIGRVGENNIEISLPTVDLRELSTTVTVRDGQMVVIGGLIQNKDTIQDSQVPFLGNIPVIGHLFKSRDKVNEKTELVIMLKPVVVTQ